MTPYQFYWKWGMHIQMMKLFQQLLLRILIFAIIPLNIRILLIIYYSLDENIIFRYYFAAISTVINRVLKYNKTKIFGGKNETETSWRSSSYKTD